MRTLKSAQLNDDLEGFINEREPLDAPKEVVQRYIDASAIPLEKPSEGQSSSSSDFSADYK